MGHRQRVVLSYSTNSRATHDYGGYVSHGRAITWLKESTNITKLRDWLDKHILLKIHDRNGCSVDKDSVMDALQKFAEQSFVEMERAMSDGKGEVDGETCKTLSVTSFSYPEI
jgi:hypothetical protein